MNIIEALGLCQSGHLVRPVCWRTLNTGHWIEAIPTPTCGEACFFAEHGTMEEIPHSLRLARAREFFGEWETVELDDQRRIKE